MSFFHIEPSKDIAVVVKDNMYTYSDLKYIAEWYNFLSYKKELVLILGSNTIDNIAAYLSALSSHQAVMLMSADTSQELLEHIVETYEPKWIVGEGERLYQGYSRKKLFLVRNSETEYEIHPDLALLLNTSGTTGSRKFVRLSYGNLQSNAESIAEYLRMDSSERAVMNLPLSYSYGLSIVNSHLLVKASILLTDESVISKSFWELVNEHKPTSIPGVPFTYQMLQRIGFSKMDLPFLKTMTQAGGRLSENLVRLFAQYALDHNKRFFVMYGQTEASPRMSFVPPERILEKIGSIGIPIPNGHLSIHSETQELIYKGSNVMMGYAERIEDLAKGDEMNRVLYTGDIATVDEEGYYSIIGRKKRFLKLYGLRINLDDVEAKLEAEIHATFACTGNDDKLVVVSENDLLVADVEALIERLYKLHKSAYKVVVIDAIPRLINGKTDYITLRENVM
jgi:acyl-CoA synthetase (AMP-forming)/AMP-acid ligase II